jgi:phosphohistidine phosphatase SixA
VGHNPLLSHFLAALLSAAGNALDLSTASLACVDLGTIGPQPRGRLVWLLSPRVCP